MLPGNKKFVEGDMLPRSGQGGGAGAPRPGEGDGEDAFRFVLSREEFLDLFLDDLELPDLAKRKLAEVEQRRPAPRRLCHLRLAGQYLGQPHRAAGAGAAHRAAAAAAGDDRRARGRNSKSATTPRRDELTAELAALKAKMRRIPLHRSDRHPLSPL